MKCVAIDKATHSNPVLAIVVSACRDHEYYSVMGRERRATVVIPASGAVVSNETFCIIAQNPLGNLLKLF